MQPPGLALVDLDQSITAPVGTTSGSGHQRPNETIDFESALTSTPDISLHRTIRRGQIRTPALQRFDETGEEAWWPLFDEAKRPLFPELMAELDEIKKRVIGGHIFRREHAHRRSTIPLPWITARGDLDYVRSVVKQIIRTASLRDDLSFTSFLHGGFTEGADSDLTDAELRAAGRHRSARQLPTYAKRTRKRLVSVATKRRAERTKAADLSE
jgi:hypothetical protein